MRERRSTSKLAETPNLPYEIFKDWYQKDDRRLQFLALKQAVVAQTDRFDLPQHIKEIFLDKANHKQIQKLIANMRSRHPSVQKA